MPYYRETLVSLCIAGVLCSGTLKVNPTMFPIASGDETHTRCEGGQLILIHWRAFLEEALTSDLSIEAVYQHLLILDEDMVEQEKDLVCKVQEPYIQDFENVLDLYQSGLALYNHGRTININPEKLTSWLLRVVIYRMLLWEIRLK